MSFQDLYGAGAFGGGPPAMAGPPALSTDTAGPGIAALLAKARGAVGSLLPPSPFASFAPPANAAPGAPPAMPPAPAPQTAAPATPGAGFTPPMPQPRPPGATPGMPMSLAPPNPGPGTPNPGTMNPGMLQNFLQMLKQGQTPQAAPGGQGGQAPGASQGAPSQGLFPKMFNDGSNLYKAFSAAGAPAAAAGGTSSAAFTGALAGLF